MKLFSGTLAHNQQLICISLFTFYYLKHFLGCGMFVLNHSDQCLHTAENNKQASDVWAHKTAGDESKMCMCTIKMFKNKKNNEAYLQPTKDEQGIESTNVYLDSQNSKHDKKSTADEDNIPDGP